MAKSSVKSYSEVIGGGDLLESLQATRDRIAADLDQCDSMRDKAALYLRMAAVLDRIEQVRPEPERGDVVDEIASRRAARRAGSTEGQTRAQRPS